MGGWFCEPRSLLDVVDGETGCYCELTRINLKESNSSEWQREQRMVQVISSFIVAVIRSDPVAAYRKGGGQPQNFPAEGEENPKTFQPASSAQPISYLTSWSGLGGCFRLTGTYDRAWRRRCTGQLIYV
jgi:hypothetical protein